jgi:hypothetical protein
MATTTPNFGWAVPTSTDLVKDGAVAIETLGDSIDASLVDLKGGTTNQVLAKNSNTDMDFKWVSDATGMTNPMTTTGDTIYSSSGSTPARLGIGSTGQVLTVAGGVPTWATAGGASGLTLVTRQSFSGVADTSTTFDGRFTSTYKSYLICFEEIYSSTNNTFLYFQYRYAGPTTQAGAYYGSVTNYDHNGTTSNTTIAGAGQISVCKIGSSGTATNGNIVTLNVNGVGTSSQKPAITALSAGNAQTGAFLLGCSCDTARTYTGFILSAAAGNITGTVAVYGLAV